MPNAIGIGISPVLAQTAGGGALLPQAVPGNKLALDPASLGHLPYLADVDRMNNESGYYPFALRSDGTTTDRREEWTPGTKGDVAGMPVTWLIENLKVPASNPAATIRILDIAGTDAPPTTAGDRTGILITSSGALTLYNQDTANVTSRQFKDASFIADHAGTTIGKLAVVFADPNTTTDPKVFEDGIDISSQFTASGASTNWMDASLDTTKLTKAYNWPGSNAPTSRIVIGALSDAEAADWSNGTTTKTWNISVATLDGVTRETGQSIGGRTDVTKLTEDGLGGYHRVYGGSFATDIAQTSRVMIYIPSSNARVNGVKLLTTSSGDTNHDPIELDTWVEITHTANTGRPSAIFQIQMRSDAATSYSSGSDVIYLAPVEHDAVNTPGDLPAWALLEGDAQAYIADWSSTVDSWEVNGAGSVSVAGSELVLTGALSAKRSLVGFSVVGGKIGVTSTFTVHATIRLQYWNGSAFIDIDAAWDGSRTVFTLPDTGGPTLVLALRGVSAFNVQSFQVEQQGQPIIPVYSRGSSVVNSSWGDLQGTLVGLDYDRNDPTFPTAPFLLQHEVKAGVPTGLRLPGVAGNYVSRADPGIATDDLEEIFGFIVPATGVTYTLGGQALNTTTRQWYLTLYASGIFKFVSSPDGTSGNQITRDSTESLYDYAVEGEIVYVKTTLDGDNGASGNTATFALGASPSGPWTPLGTDVIKPGTTTIFDGGSPVELGAVFLGTSQNVPTKIFYYSHADTIDGTPLCSPNFATATPYQTTILDTVDSAEWTVSKSAAFTGQDGDGELFMNSPAATDYASTPSNTDFDAHAEIELIVRLKPVAWSIGSPSQPLLTKWDGGTSEKSFGIQLANGGKLQWLYSTDGSTTQNEVGSAHGLTDGTIGWVRITRTRSTGLISFYTSAEQVSAVGDVNWTANGTATAAVGSDLDINTAAFTFLGNQAETNTCLGDLYYASISTVIGGTPELVFTPDALGSTSWVDSVSGQTVTVNQSNYSVARFEEPLGNTTHLPGIAGNFVSGPAIIPVSGERLRTRYKIRPNDYTPVANTVLAGVWLPTGNQKSWVHFISATSGYFSMAVSADGSAVVNGPTTIPLPEGTEWLEIDWTVGTGYVAKTSYDGITYNDLETVSIATIPDPTTTAVLELGSDTGGAASLFSGRYTRFQAYLDEVLVRDYNSANGNANSVTVEDAAVPDAIRSMGVFANGGSGFSTFNDATSTGVEFSDSAAAARRFSTSMGVSGLVTGDQVTVEFDWVKTAGTATMALQRRLSEDGGVQETIISNLGSTGHKSVTFTWDGDGEYFTWNKANNGDATATGTITDLVVTRLAYQYTINSTGENRACIVSAPRVRFLKASSMYGLMPYDIQQLNQAATVISAHALTSNSSPLLGSDGSPVSSMGRRITTGELQIISSTNLADGTYGDLMQVIGFILNATVSEIEQNMINVVTGDTGTQLNLVYIFRDQAIYGNGDLGPLALFDALVTDANRKGVTRGFAEKSDAAIIIL